MLDLKGWDSLGSSLSFVTDLKLTAGTAAFQLQ